MFTEVDPRKLAAVVYDDRVSIDSLLAVFANDLLTTGIHVAGVVQLAEEGGCGPGAPARLVDVATGDVLPMCEVIGDAQPDCRLSRALFDRAASRIRAGCDDRAELIVVSRFGRMEVNGEGFRAEMRRVIQAGRPLLTAVRRGFSHRWFEFTGGVGTVLEAHLWVLHDWWRELAPRETRACG